LRVVKPLRARVGAVIAHADESTMLARCIAHHRAIGVERILVVLNTDDPESAAVVRRFEDDSVRAVRLDTDPSSFLTAAKDMIAAWTSPDWVLVADSDEFWLPASGKIHEVAHLADAGVDVLTVPRFNAPPILAEDGSLSNVDTVDAAQTLLFAARVPNAAASLEAEPCVPWSAVEIGPKVMLRPHRVDRVGQGGHRADADAGAVAVRAEDVLIVHIPFTSELRFRRKIDAIRERLAAFPDRFRDQVGWHWQRWKAIDDAGGTTAEFVRQFIASSDVPALLAREVLMTPRAMFEGAAVR
jgi:CTP:molybdopterin cytidylyltransferase MocA